MRTLRPLLLLALLLAVWGPGAAPAAELAVHVLDVGQGDAIFVRSPAGKTVLVDAGPPEAAPRLIGRLKELVPGQLDLVLMTHPHADHLGAMEAVIAELGARIFMEPGFDHPSPLYLGLLKAVEAKGVQLKVGKAGNNVEIGGGAVMHLLSPGASLLKGTRSDANANSIVIRLIYGKTAFYLAADSEAETEQRILESGEDLRSTVYKVAHHGSRHSSSVALLERIRPRLAVVSSGAGNDYGHPTREALDRLEALRAVVLRTDLDGEVVLRSDGEKVTYATEKGVAPVGELLGGERADQPKAPQRPLPKGPVERVVAGAEPPTAAQPAEGFLASRHGEVFHRPECSNAARIKPANLIRYRTRAEALASKRPAKDCNP